MNKSDLVEALSEKEDLTKTKAEEVINLVFAEMTDALVIGRPCGNPGSWEFQGKTL